MPFFRHIRARLLRAARGHQRHLYRPLCLFFKQFFDSHTQIDEITRVPQSPVFKSRLKDFFYNQILNSLI